MQVALKLDAAQLAGAAAILRKYRKAKQELDAVIQSILDRSQITDATGWTLHVADSALIVHRPDPVESISEPPHVHEEPKGE